MVQLVLPTKYNKEFSRIEQAAEKIKKDLWMSFYRNRNWRLFALAQAAVNFEIRQLQRLDKETPDIYFSGNSIEFLRFGGVDFSV